MRNAIIAILAIGMMFIMTMAPAFAAPGDTKEETQNIVGLIMQYLGYFVGVAGVFVLVAGIIMYALAQRESDPTRQSGAIHWLIAGGLMIIVGFSLGAFAQSLVNLLTPPTGTIETTT
jgi:uncharacterized membrane protein